MSIPSIISSPTFSWLPPLILGIFLLIGIGFGFWNGWKSAIFYFSVNILGLIAAMLTFKLVWNKRISPILSEMITKLKVVDKDALNLAQSPIMIIYVLIILLLTNALAIIPYIFLRKYLKKNIRENKESSVSNVKSRILGSTIGFIIAVPYATILASLSTVLSPSNSFVRSIDKITNVTTFGQAKKVSEDFDDTIGMLKIATDPKKIQELKKAFDQITEASTSPNALNETLNKNKDAIQAIIKRPNLVINTINKINEEAKKQGGTIISIKAEVKKITSKNIDETLKKLTAVGINVTLEELKKVIEIISKS